MEKFSKYVGLDVHKDTIAVAIAAEDSEVRFYGEIANNPTAIIKLVKLLSKEGGQVRAGREDKQGDRKANNGIRFWFQAFGFEV